MTRPRFSPQRGWPSPNSGPTMQVRANPRRACGSSRSTGPLGVEQHRVGQADHQLRRGPRVGPAQLSAPRALLEQGHHQASGDVQRVGAPGREVGEEEIRLDLQQPAHQGVAPYAFQRDREGLDHALAQVLGGRKLSTDVQEGQLHLPGHDGPHQVVTGGEPSVQRGPSMAGDPRDVVHAETADPRRLDQLTPCRQQRLDHRVGVRLLLGRCSEHVVDQRRDVRDGGSDGRRGGKLGGLGDPGQFRAGHGVRCRGTVVGRM